MKIFPTCKELIKVDQMLCEKNIGFQHTPAGSIYVCKARIFLLVDLRTLLL